LRLILDIGGTHNDLDYLKRAIDSVKEFPMIMLKAQLWDIGHPAGQTNPRLDWGTFEKAHRHARDMGVTFSASVFDGPSYEFLSGLGPAWIKFAYSMRESPLLTRAIEDGNDVIVSLGWMNNGRHTEGITRLLMPVPDTYPVLTRLDYSREWWGWFDGLSDHSVGIRQSVEAAGSGCQLLEKHVKFPGYASCPDAQFAVDWDRVKDLIYETTHL